jgi:hypothetical protein
MPEGCASCTPSSTEQRIKLDHSGSFRKDRLGLAR